MLSKINRALVFQGIGLTHTKKLKIVNWLSEVAKENRTTDEEKLFEDGVDEEETDVEDMFKPYGGRLPRYYDLMTTINKLIQKTIIRILALQLQCFSWLPQFLLQGETLKLVLDRYLALKTLEIYEPKFIKYSVSASEGFLEKFSCRSMGSWYPDRLDSILQKSSETLRSLTLGQERFWMRENRLGGLDTTVPTRTIFS